MLQKKDFNISFRGNNLHIAAELMDGGGDMLFMIHGLGCSGESFRSIREYPFFSRYTVVVPDLPGFGKSTFDEKFSCTLQDHAAVCRELIGEFGPRRVHVVGHSMGGAIGVLLCTLLGEQSASFVNVEGNLVAADCGVSRKTMSMPFENFRETLLLELQMMAEATGEKGIRLWAAMTEQASPVAYDRSAGSLVKWSDSGALLANFIALTCPKVYVYGERNAGLKALAGIASIPSRAIPRCGHFPMNDNPDSFYEYLAEWLESL